MPRNPEHTLIQFLVTMAFVIMVAIFNWFKRRQSESPPPQPTEKRSEPPPPRSRRSSQEASPPIQPRKAPRPTRWEEELRRFLEGEPEPTSSPKPAPSPSAPSHIPPPPPLITTSTHPVVPHELVVRQEQPPTELPARTSSVEAYQRASQLDIQVAERLKQVSQQVGRHSLATPGDITSLETARMLHLLRNKDTLRSLVMASIVLGPPKAMEA